MSPSAPATAVALGTAAALVTAAARESAKSTLAQADSLLDDYVSLRLSVLEQKMQLMGSIEDALKVDKDRLEMDRHDLQVERAQHASFVQAETHMGLF